MPTVQKFQGYRVAIYTNDHRPCHVHVVGAGGTAVFWLACPEGPPNLRDYYNLKRSSLLKIQKHLALNLDALCREWRSIHGDF